MSEPAAVEHYALRPYNPAPDIAFAEDGGTLYVLELDYSFDVGWVLVGLWPELAGVGVLLLVLLVGWRLRRQWRTSRGTAGQPHCATCHYNLSGLHRPEQCPECGQALTRAEIYFPRPFRRGRAILLLSVPVTMGLMVLLCAGVSGRYTWPIWELAEWANLRSSTIYRLGMSWDSDLVRNHAMPRSRLVGLDLDTGQRRVVHEEDRTYLNRLHVADELIVLNEHSRRVIVVRETDAGPRAVGHDHYLWGVWKVSNFFLSADGNRLRFIDEQGQVHQSDAPPDQRNVDWQAVGRPLESFFQVDRHIGRRVWAAMEPGGEQLWATLDGREYRSWDMTTGSLRHTIRIRGGHVVDAAGAETAPEVAWIVGYDAAAGGFGRIEVWDFGDGSFQREVAGPGDGRFRAVAMSPGGRYLYAASSEPPHDVHVLDVEADDWIATLSPPAGTQWYGKLQVNPAGDRLVATTWSDRRTRVVGWDVSAWADPYEEEEDEP